MQAAMMRTLMTTSVLVAAMTASGSVAADPVPPRASDGVTTPAKAIASTDDASSILINPANLAFGPGLEARFTAIHTGDDSPIPNRGYSVDLGAPFWILATGLRLDWLTPPSAAPSPFADSGVAHRYSWVRWGNAVRLGDVAAFGTTLAWSNATTARLDGLFSATSALTVRANPFLSLAVVARDWNSPENDTGQEIEPSVDLGLAFRPVMGRRLLELALEGSYRSDVERWVPSASVAVNLPYIGRLRGGVQMIDPADAGVVATAALDVNLGNLQVTGGTVLGNSIGLDNTGFVVGAAVRDFLDEPRLPSPAKVVRIRFEATPDVRGHIRLLRLLWKMADDDDVDGVLFELRTAPAGSLAHTEELVDAVKLLRNKGKKVLCHLEDGNARQLFLCSAANRIAVNPAGGLRFAGLATRHLYFGGMLDKLGVKADFVRIGVHKLAPEQFTGESSAVGKLDHRELLDNYEKIYLGQVGRGRGLDFATTKRNVAKGPFLASEARDARLVDVLAYEDEINRFVQESFGRPVRVVPLDVPTVQPEYWRTPSKIAVVYLHGDMVDGRSQKIPIIGIRLAGSYTVAKALKQAREDSSVKAVVFRIETGGGSSLAADVILREAQLTAKVKPLIVSMGAKAASGGYYAAVAGKQIFSNRATITGSIGIFYGKVDVTGLLGKLGIRAELNRTAPRADAESFFRPFTDAERIELGRKVKQFYDLFIGRVAEGRHMTPAEVHALAQGKVWTGEQAKAHGLVDQLGGIRQALAYARKLASLPSDAPILELPVEEPTLFETVLKFAGVPGVKVEAGESFIPPQMKEMARVLVPLVMYESYKPMARIESALIEP
jgi:protease-4